MKKSQICAEKGIPAPTPSPRRGHDKGPPREGTRALILSVAKDPIKRTEQGFTGFIAAL